LEAALVTFSRTALAVFLVLFWNIAVAQINGEEGEPTPEYLDATFTSEDAARVAAGFSDQIIGDSSADPVGDMTNAADLVFRGSVLSQTYVYDAAGTPSTHTTFLITEQLKGDHQSDEITLVQPGGPSQFDSDEVMMVSTARYFTVGVEELLFMGLDPESQVESRRATVLSRFRIYENKIYNEDGHGVIVVPLEDGTRYGLVQSRDRNPDARFRRINIGSHWLSKQFGKENNSSSYVSERNTGAGRAGSGNNGYSDSADIDAFSALIRR
jgi:hypothetical protein